MIMSSVRVSAWALAGQAHAGRFAPPSRHPGLFHRAEWQFTMWNIDAVPGSSSIPIRKTSFLNAKRRVQVIEINQQIFYATLI
jgi:hypothetical protein